MKSFKTYWYARLQKVVSLLHKGPIAWLAVVLVVIAFFAPFPLMGSETYVWEAYLSLALIPITASALLRGRLGAFAAWILVSLGLNLFGGHGASSLITAHQEAFTILGFGHLVMALAAGQFFSTRKRLVRAHNALEEAHTTIQRQALTDALTGLPNHRALMDQLSKELNRAQRFERPLSLLFLDADHFKSVNDTYGHTVGDAVLYQIGEKATNALRGGDTLGRFGGEEFVFLLPEANAEEAKAIAERVRKAVAAEPLASTNVDAGIPMTVSLGVATYPEDGRMEEDLLKEADQAMYMSKRLGRNQARTASEARQARTDLDLMALFEEEERREALEREGQQPEQIRQSYRVGIIASLLSLLELRDPGMRARAQAVSELATAIAQEMGLDANQVSRIGMAAALHDIGKVAVPDSLLRKAGPLSPAESDRLRQHPEMGAQILEASTMLHDLIPAVRYHHELWDGTGYPDKLSGGHIPLAARIIAVAEAYDAMYRNYPYQAEYSPAEARDELQSRAGKQFDPEVVQAFSEVLSASYHKSEQPV